MSLNFKKNFQTLESKITPIHFQNIKRGFEKESLRISSDQNLAQTPHPRSLGSALTHPLITTDYSESLLEFITLPTTSIETLFQDLYNIHHFTHQMLKKYDEYLWVSSMPCQLPSEKDIPIANYGKSNYGQLKYIYRCGLGLRYGRSMQTISGVHYNFSLPESFFKAYHTLKNSSLSLQDFTSEQYLGLIRNCLRFSYILPVLFGASPAAGANFVKNTQTQLASDLPNTLYGPYATSLRLSDVGYNNKKVAVPISYNTLAEFIANLREAIHSPYSEYVELGVKNNGVYQQLSDCLLQVEDEHYALIRPKRVSPQNNRMLHTIEKEGIEYIEVRALDLNPYSLLGIEKEAVYLLDCFLLVCLLSDSPTLDQAENEQIRANMDQVLKLGRQKNLQITIQAQQIDFLDWCLALLDNMSIAAKLLDQANSTQHFAEACQKAKSQLRFENQSLLSAQILAEMTAKRESYHDFVNRLSLQHQQTFLETPLPTPVKQEFEHLAIQSLKKQLDLEQADTLNLDIFINQYLEN